MYWLPYHEGNDLDLLLGRDDPGVVLRAQVVVGIEWGHELLGCVYRLQVVARLHGVVFN